MIDWMYKYNKSVADEKKSSFGHVTRFSFTFNELSVDGPVNTSTEAGMTSSKVPL
ncbi:hypothetical protein [Pontibacter pamirensis]|uniref:hypothetical protein n=1 Tax=Pontibacter pamirensis TaxID=2562824 RepID=UPI001389530E|nr:hypothetical protein [Pontibacter pamirensis]